MDWRRWTVRALAVLVFLALPYALKHLRLIQTLSDGIYLATGIAVVLYTVETFYLRRETSNLRRETAAQNAISLEQVKLGTEQVLIAREQAEAAIRPLLVSRIEKVPDFGGRTESLQFVLRNIGHGPALFVQINLFTVEIPNKGARRVRVFSIDLVEPGGIGIPQVEFHLAEGQVQGQLPGYMEFVDGLTAAPSGHASTRHEITITYEDIQKRRFQSVMEMGLEGTKLLRYERT